MVESLFTLEERAIKATAPTISKGNGIIQKAYVQRGNKGEEPQKLRFLSLFICLIVFDPFSILAFYFYRMKAKTRKQLAKEFKVSVVTFTKWVSEFMEVPLRRNFWPKEVEKIYEELGNPNSEKE